MHDLILTGGEIHDGFGSAPITADVAVTNGRITAVGTDLGPARRTFDTTGLVVAPGFVDAHSHSDKVPFLPDPQPFKLFQGVTTEIIGNCGFSPGPTNPAVTESGAVTLGKQEFRTFGEYLDAAEAAGPSNHLAALVGHNTVRMAVAGMELELPPGGLDRMCDLIEEAFAAGAVGFSSGLEYVPGAYADRAELIALARVARRYGGTYATHSRSESEGLADALDEAVDVARSAGIRLQYSHCKASGRAVHGSSLLILEKLAAARRSGVDAKGDQYPYQAFATDLLAMLPPAACEGGVEAMRARLSDPATRASLQAVAENPHTGMGVGLWREVHPEDVQILRHTDPAVTGRRLAQVLNGRKPWDALCDLLIADPHANTVCHTMDEGDVLSIMADPLVAIGSDGGSPVGPNHPRAFGTFPTFLGTYVRDRGVVDLPEAIRKVSSATAGQFGLTDRGWLGRGAAADLVAFDPATIGHAGTYERPDVRPTGMVHVLLDGEPVIIDGEFTGARRGRMLRSGRP
ncbi:N-acyl-D-amino-acid deacylase family protein [Arthrobacter sp. B2a2-09]|uniref:N-acyl-D-amino-acid deacylase family protein n=1 Tax=Arthrobacter sp. B2a2-09 TaxID=2952822 RepID=UPI0022CDB872|nr:D-aminoacylase [Arthrobacter sp. B2a2-09]MCZ9883176.1 D-aminoacylase [Arthrobacter sp. B2a2-09]